MDSILFFFGHDLQDYWDFFAFGEELPFDRRSLYPDDLVNPVQLSFKDKNPILFLSYLIFAFNQTNKEG